MRDEKKEISAACGQYEERHTNWEIRRGFLLFPDEGEKRIVLLVGSTR